MDVLDSPEINQLDSNQKAELMKQVRQQLAVASTQELLEKMSRKCFNKCINKPGSSLDSSEQKCIAMCMDRFMDSWNLVSRAYFTRLQRESSQISMPSSDIKVCIWEKHLATIINPKNKALPTQKSEKLLALLTKLPMDLLSGEGISWAERFLFIKVWMWESCLVSYSTKYTK